MGGGKSRLTSAVSHCVHILTLKGTNGVDNYTPNMNLIVPAPGSPMYYKPKFIASYDLGIPQSKSLMAIALKTLSSSLLID